VQSWDEIARTQQLTAKLQQNQCNIGLVATTPATCTPMFL